VADDAGAGKSDVARAPDLCSEGFLNFSWLRGACFCSLKNR
jgi:hypothetical protein